jgi:MFS family permease
MTHPIRKIYRRYPFQFWLLILGQLISMTGSGFIWPFIALYMRESLDISLSTVSLILTLRAGATLFSSFFIGPYTDRIGRKKILVISLFFGAVAFFLLDFANSIIFFAILMAGWGATQPLYRISTEAMIADLVPEENRLGAYSLLRISMNVGVALGPVFGGMLVAYSYSFAFYIACFCLLLVSMLSFMFIKETLDLKDAGIKTSGESRQELKEILHDNFFLLFCTGILVVYTMSSQVFILLSSYLSENFGIMENQVGIIMAVNAIMIISLQFFVARILQNKNPIRLIAIGTLFYIIGVSSNAIGFQMWHFVISMMIITTGELILAPTATTFTANYAPARKRGLYMSFTGLANGVGHGMGPVVGALFNDLISPQAIWYGSGLVGIIAFVIFVVLAKQYSAKLKANTSTQAV